MTKRVGMSGERSKEKRGWREEKKKVVRRKAKRTEEGGICTVE